MRWIYLRLAVLSLVMLLQGCGAFLPNEQQIIAAGSYGPRPTREEADAIVRQYLVTVLKDPYSAQFGRIGSIEEHYASAGQLRPRLDDPTLHYGWFVQYSYNAKNSYGAYTGMQSAAVFIRDGRVIDHYEIVKSGQFERWSKNVHQWQ